MQDVALSPGAHRDVPVLSPKVQLQGQGLNVVPGVEPSTTSPQAPFPSPDLGGLRNEDAGQHGEGCPL